jgi:hypothetical protein
MAGDRSPLSNTSKTIFLPIARGLLSASRPGGFVVELELFSLLAGESAEINPGREIIEMKHRIVFAIRAVECSAFTQPHVLQVEGDKTSVTPLYAAPELFSCLFNFHPENLADLEYQAPCFHAVQANASHPARKASPPRGVMAPNQRAPVKDKRYKLPENRIVPATNA